MKYFTGFQKITYNFGTKSLQMMNVFNRPNSVIDYGNSIYEYTTTFVEDGFSPDRASTFIYRDADFFWTILLFNNIIDIYKDWPMSYSYWKDEMMAIHTGETFYTEYILDLAVGDIVVKNLPSDDTGSDVVFFDDSNYGVVTDFDSFLRSFDVFMLKGSLQEGDEYYILRKSDFTFEKVKYQSQDSFILRRKEQKQNSLSSFNLFSGFRGAYQVVSPYSNKELTNVVSHQIPDIKDHTDTLLYKYIFKQNIDPMIVETFFEEKQKEWQFKKNINVLPASYLRQIENSYFDGIATG